MIAASRIHHGFWIGRVLAVGRAGDPKNARQIAQPLNLPSAHCPESEFSIASRE